MLTILNALYESNLRAGRNEGLSDAEHDKATAALMKARQKLLDVLPAEQSTLVDEFSAAFGNANEFVCRQGFIDGYRLGALLMLAVFDGPLDAA